MEEHSDAPILCSSALSSRETFLLFIVYVSQESENFRGALSHPRQGRRAEVLSFLGMLVATVALKTDDR